jgi:hypothetical protein
MDSHDGIGRCGLARYSEVSYGLALSGSRLSPVRDDINVAAHSGLLKFIRVIDSPGFSLHLVGFTANVHQATRRRRHARFNSRDVFVRTIEVELD